MTVPRTQVLMGLNFSQLTCHFTSTANLTACQLPATRWHAYTRATDASTAAAFDVSAGFLGAGDDARSPAELSVAGCEAACVGLASCRGFTFQAESARPAGQVKCHFKTAIHLTAEKDDCVAPGGEGKPACSPLPGEMGLGGYYGHYQVRAPHSALLATRHPPRPLRAPRPPRAARSALPANTQPTRDTAAHAGTLALGHGLPR